MKINPQRLSRYVMSKDHKNSQDHLLEIYDALTPAQRQELKEMFKKNKEAK